MSSNIQSLGVCAIPPIVHPVRIAVVGCGYWGMNYVRILSELMESRLVAICDGRSERLREVLLHGSGPVAGDFVMAAACILGLLAGLWFFERLSPHFEDFL